MRSPEINGEGELRGQLANPGSPGKMAVKMECVCVCVSFYSLSCNPGQVVNTCMPLSPSSIIGTSQCLASRKVTVGLVLHWPRVTDISDSPPTGVKA